MTTTEQNWTQNAEIQIFQEYLRIRTDHPDVNYSKWHFNQQIYSTVCQSHSSCGSNFSSMCGIFAKTG